jgi:hypothetical protein
MLVDLSDHEIIVINAAALVADTGVLYHWASPSRACVNVSFTTNVNSRANPLVRGKRFPYRSVGGVTRLRRRIVERVLTRAAQKKPTWV